MRKRIRYRPATWRTIRNWVIRTPASRFEMTDKRTGKRARFTSDEAYLLCCFGVLGALQ